MTATHEPIAPQTGLGGWDGFGPDRTRSGGLAETWRTFATAVRLGWSMEANWTDPVLFFIYSVAKPVSAALILVAMLEVIGGASTREYRGYVVTGSALWAFVTSGIAGLAWSILDDRERYRMIKYVYVSSAGFLVFLVGRAVARALVGAVGAVITLAFGVVLLGVPFDPAVVDWLGLVVVSSIGVVAIVSIGVIMGAIVLQTRQEAWAYSEALAGALFLVSGAVFPLAVLPFALQVVALLTPLAWWVEGTRRALFGPGVSGIGGPGSAWESITGTLAPDGWEILTALLLTGAVGTLVALLAFRVSERRAKDRGLLDQTTGS
jgi:ABC-2 type transport system permease protein